MLGFRRNPNFAKEVSREPEMGEALEASAQAVARLAAGLSPHGTGATARSFVVAREGDKVTVGNTDPFFHLTEFGSVNNPPYAPLRRAVRATGLRLEETGP